MDSSTSLYQFFWAVLEQLPSLITLVVCMVVVMRRRQRHPRASRLAFIGLALTFVQGPLFAAIFATESFFIGRSMVNLSDANWLRAILGALYSLTLALALLPLLVAVYAERKSAG
jgi:L-cystine uptake protein TcyP (sodium:dicarboxylate symporter family)